MLWVALFILLILTVMLKLYTHNRYRRELIYKMPGPRPWPLLGNSHHFQLPLEDLFVYLRKCFKEYKGIYQIYAPNVQAINIFDPKDVETILSTNRFNEKRLPYTLLRPWLCEGLLVSNGNKWHQRRKMLTRAFHFNILKKYFRTFIEQSENLQSKIHDEVFKEKTNITYLISKATLNITCDIITDVDGNDKVYGDKGRLAMLDLLLESEKEGIIDMEGIREEVDTFMFEGHDTTAMALSFMIMRFANEPAIQDMIYEEMRNLFGESQRSPTLEDLSSMKYLECCIKESLRLYPSVPFIARYTTEEMRLSGYTIPSDSLLQIHVYDIHHDENLYPDPEKFIPDRFFPENSIKRHPYAYLPFSAGPRNCIGQKFAMMEMKTVMSSLLRKYRLEPVTKLEDLIFTCDIVLRTVDPIFVKFCHRKTGQPVN